ncbi:MAG: sigma-70 family RNA polymerase sigma factor [Calditrichaeota bacterium]|nr:MAG: sigma-70 family RNA polymerase sigma factor [Calditrichota bacterium]
MTLESKTDDQLMLSYASGDLAAFEELFRRYGKRLYNLFLRSVNREDLAQDLLQECFLKVIEARDRYRPRTAFSSWIFTIAMNLIRDTYRRRQRRTIETTGNLEAANLETRSSDGDPHKDLEKSQMSAAVASAMDALPRDQREVLLLSKYQGVPFLEIAEILQISPAAAKQKAYRGMQNLRKRLAFLKED